MSDNSKKNKKKKPRGRLTRVSEYNESPVRRGEVFLNLIFLQNLWQAAELKKMNKANKGTNYRLPNSLIFVMLVARVHAYLLSYYRQL